MRWSVGSLHWPLGTVRWIFGLAAQFGGHPIGLLPTKITTTDGSSATKTAGDLGYEIRIHSPTVLGSVMFGAAVMISNLFRAPYRAVAASRTFLSAKEEISIEFPKCGKQSFDHWSLLACQLAPLSPRSVTSSLDIVPLTNPTQNSSDGCHRSCDLNHILGPNERMLLHMRANLT